jgi:hypothetical protein
MRATLLLPDDPILIRHSAGRPPSAGPLQGRSHSLIRIRHATGLSPQAWDPLPTAPCIPLRGAASHSPSPLRRRRAALLLQDSLISIQHAAWTGRFTHEWDPRPLLRAQSGGELLRTLLASSPQAGRAALWLPDSLICIQHAAGRSPQEWDPFPLLWAQPRGELLHAPREPLRCQLAALLLQDSLIRIRHAAGRSPQAWYPCPPLWAQPGGELLRTPREQLRCQLAALLLPDCPIRIRHAAGRTPQAWDPCPLLQAQPGGELLRTPRASSRRSARVRSMRAALLLPDSLVRIQHVASWAPHEWEPRTLLRAQPSGELLHSPRASSAAGERRSCCRIA